MNLEALVSRVKNIVQDISYTEDDIIELLNEAALVIAEQVRLPDLSIGSAEVLTEAGEHQAAMPADYHHWLFRCMDGTRQVNVRSNLEELLMVYGGSLGNDGDVADVVAQGMTLFYQPVPVDPVPLLLFYSKKPAVLAADGDIPSFMPARFHKMLAVYAASEIFDDIEDGVNAAKVNTEAQRQKFRAALEELRAYTTRRQTR